MTAVRTECMHATKLRRAWPAWARTSLGVLAFALAARCPAQQPASLPDDPATRMQQQPPAPPTPPLHCDTLEWSWKVRQHPGLSAACDQAPLQMIVGAGPVRPLTSREKAELAGRNIIDPFNVLTITAYSGVYVAANAHSPYGPGLHGFGRLVGYSFAEDTQGEFFGVYAIPSLAHEDPRYHRMPDRPVGVRILHALSHTVVTRHDDGTLMPNYATLLTYPISAELSNAYVPGLSTDGRSTRNRILVGYATDPAGALIAEFLPDVAKRIHVRVVFVQQILNQLATSKSNTP